MSLQTILDNGLDTLGIASTPAQQAQALRYITLIEKWNRVDNLTAISDAEQMVVHHLLDSLAVHPYLPPAQTVLDVGSGAGLPGIPLAIFNPHISFTLLDAAAKRVRFMRHAVTTLALDNVSVIQGRADAYCAEHRADLIISRAFTSTADFVRQTAVALAEGGRLFAMKGKLPQQELGALAANFEYTVVPLQVPGLAAERHLITITAMP